MAIDVRSTLPGRRRLHGVACSGGRRLVAKSEDVIRHWMWDKRYKNQARACTLLFSSLPHTRAPQRKGRGGELSRRPHSPPLPSTGRSLRTLISRVQPHGRSVLGRQQRLQLDCTKNRCVLALALAQIGLLVLTPFLLSSLVAMLFEHVPLASRLPLASRPAPPLPPRTT